jgi:hypothetical protein
MRSGRGGKDRNNQRKTRDSEITHEDSPEPCRIGVHFGRENTTADPI